MADIDQVDIGECYRDRGRQRRSIGLLGEISRRDRGDDRHVVGAGNGDVDRALDRAAVAVVERNREVLDPGLTLSQVLDSGIRNAVAPLDNAAEAVDGVRIYRCAQ